MVPEGTFVMFPKWVIILINKTRERQLVSLSLFDYPTDGTESLGGLGFVAEAGWGWYGVAQAVVWCMVDGDG